MGSATSDGSSANTGQGLGFRLGMMGLRKCAIKVISTVICLRIISSGIRGLNKRVSL